MAALNGHRTRSFLPVSSLALLLASLGAGGCPRNKAPQGSVVAPGNDLASNRSAAIPTRHVRAAAQSPMQGCKKTAAAQAITWLEQGRTGRSAISEASFRRARNQPDLDGDGVKDLVLLRGGSGLRSARHFFFVKRKGCHKLVGVIPLSPLLGFHCRKKRRHGLCDLGTSRLMIHGETERSTWVFDGMRYVLSGRPILGPRPRKFLR